LNTHNNFKNEVNFMRSTPITPSPTTAATAAYAATTINAPELPSISTEGSTNVSAPPLVEHPQQLVIKAGELKTIADIYIDTAKKYGLDETYNVLKHFTPNAWGGKNVVVRTFWHDRGWMNVCSPPELSKFQATIEGFLDTVNSHRSWKAEIKSSIQFAFDCIKYTLYFIESYTDKDPVKQLHQYKCAFQICSHLKTAAYESITSLTEPAVQTRFYDIQNILREEICKLLYDIEKQKIQIATQNLTEDADATLDHLLALVLKTLFDTIPPKDLLIQRHLSIFRNPEINTLAKFSKSGADKGTLDFVKNEEILAFIKYLCNSNQSSLREALEKVTTIVQDLLIKGEEKPSNTTLYLTETETDNHLALQNVFNRKEITEVREAYHRSQVERVNSAKEFATSKKLSEALNEINGQQTSSLPYTEWISEALILIGDWIRAKSSIAEVNNIVQSTAMLAPLVCGDSNILINTGQDIQQLLTRTRQVISNLGSMATNVRLKSARLQKNRAWNSNITSAERDHIVPLAALVERTGKHLANFSASIEPEYVSRSLGDINRSLLRAGAAQYLAGQPVSLPSFVRGSTRAAQQLNIQTQKENRLKHSQDLERRRLFGNLAGSTSTFAAPIERITTGEHSTIQIEEIEENESSIVSPSPSNPSASSQTQRDPRETPIPRDVNLEIANLRQRIDILQKMILEKKSQQAKCNHSNDFSFKVFKPKLWWAPLWLTGLGLVGHLLLMAVVGLYRLAKSNSINKDKKIFLRLEKEISNHKNAIENLNKEINSLQNEHTVLRNLTNNTTSQVIQVLQTNSSPSMTNVPAVAPPPVSNQNEPLVVVSNTYTNKEISQYADEWLKHLKKLLRPQLLEQIRNQLTITEIKKQADFCKAAFALIEDKVGQKFPQLTKDDIIFHAYRQMLQEPNGTAPKIRR
jgi:hypothetical protein